jgi:hypothetical protein
LSVILHLLPTGYCFFTNITSLPAAGRPTGRFFYSKNVLYHLKFACLSRQFLTLRRVQINPERVLLVFQQTLHKYF